MRGIGFFPRRYAPFTLWGDRQTGFAGRQTAAPYGLPGRSFHGVTGFCSSSAHPRNFCCIGFARMEMLAKYIRMRTARSAATASHPCVEHATEGTKKKNPADVTPQGFCKAFFKSVDQAATAERRDSSLSLPSVLSCERKRSGATARPALPVVKRLRLTACLGGLSTA